MDENVKENTYAMSLFFFTSHCSIRFRWERPRALGGGVRTHIKYAASAAVQEIGIYISTECSSLDRNMKVIYVNRKLGGTCGRN